MSATTEFLHSYSVAAINSIGAYLIFVGTTVRRSFSPRIKTKLLMRQLEFVGNRSFWIVVISAAMLGAAFGFILGDIFQKFGAQSMLGATAGVAFSKEFAPLFCGFLVTARAGAAMCAEIATMRVNEQIDAMRVMSVNPYNYLVAPRVFASVLFMPFLCCIFILVGVFVSLALGMAYFDVDVGITMVRMREIVKPGHIVDGMVKAAVFGVIFSSVGCYKGFHAGGGAKGVGKATTEAVVVSLVFILVINFFLTWLQYDKVL